MKRSKPLFIAVIVSVLGIAALLLTLCILKFVVPFAGGFGQSDDDVIGGLILYMLMLFYVGFFHLAVIVIILLVLCAWLVYGAIRLVLWYRRKYVLPRDGKRVKPKPPERYIDSYY